MASTLWAAGLPNAMIRSMQHCVWIWCVHTARGNARKHTWHAAGPGSPCAPSLCLFSLICPRCWHACSSRTRAGFCVPACSSQCTTVRSRLVVVRCTLPGCCMCFHKRVAAPWCCHSVALSAAFRDGVRQPHAGYAFASHWLCSCPVSSGPLSCAVASNHHSIQICLRICHTDVRMPLYVRIGLLMFCSLCILLLGGRVGGYLLASACEQLVHA
jgi:hypothetical protein